MEEEPPAWCIEQGKWPYHTLRWKAWLDAKRAGQNPAYPVAGQQVAAGADEAFQAGRFEEAMKLQGVLADTFSQATTSVPGGEPATAAWVFAHLSRYALFSKDYAKALSAADRAIELQAEKFLLVGTPDINAYMNKAHALMFLGRADEALALHRKWRGHKNRCGWRYRQAHSKYWQRRQGRNHADALGRRCSSRLRSLSRSGHGPPANGGDRKGTGWRLAEYSACDGCSLSPRQWFPRDYEFP